MSTAWCHVGRNAPSVCLFENPNRLVSLWDIVEQYRCIALCSVFTSIADQVARFQSFKEKHGSAAGLTDEDRQAVAGLIDSASAVAREINLEGSWQKTRRLKRLLGSVEGTNAELVFYELGDLRGIIVNELQMRKFAYLRPPDDQYFARERLFGDEVHENFPSAREDIKDAGDCLAAELSTAAVFHLMRVAEYGLRALAHDRRISVRKNTPIDLATWQQVIDKLEDAEQEIQNFPRTEAREAQFAFYHGAMMTLSRFKNKFRNRVAHARERYDRDEARSAFNHVQDFMQILASRISETKTTPRIWTKKWIDSQG